MCLAIPGKIKEIKNKTAIVEYPHEEREILLDPNIPVEVGDYVLIQMMVVIQKLDEKSAKESLEAWGEASN